MDIKKVIYSRGYTLGDVAEKLGITNQAVSQAVNGNPSLSRLKEIADAIGVTVSQLVAEEETLPDEITITDHQSGHTRRYRVVS